METRKLTPLQLFNLPQNFVVPLFQRSYVWEESEQWQPLWNDIRRASERYISLGLRFSPHFLGAVVIQAHETTAGSLTRWNLIDGQQRLTTIQILLDATIAALAERGFTSQVSRLEALTHNPAHYVPAGESALKLQHLNKDRETFAEVMNAESPVSYATLAHHDSRFARAHEYFNSAVSEWLAADSEHAEATKVDSLTHVLESGLQLISIELTSTEDSQEIFETLNARGTPLTSADLIRNFVFQRLEEEGSDAKLAYETQWPFETKFWEKEISVGRQMVSRSSLFLHQWITARTGEETSPHATFAQFKVYVEHHPHSMKELLGQISVQANLYRNWTDAASRNDGELTPTEMAVYRMQCSGSELLKPLLIWLSDPENNFDPVDQYSVIALAESWVYRRQLLKLSTGDLGRLVAEIINISASSDSGDLAPTTRDYLLNLNSRSTYWPGDSELRELLLDEPTYRRYPRARLRMYLESIENHLRKETRQPQVQRNSLPIEHILPQKWQDSWPIDTGDDADLRSSHVHRLGNLTLITTSLNSKVSNSAWSTKREALQKHNTITLTGRLPLNSADGEWNEQSIEQRSRDLIENLLKIWPVPEGHVGLIADAPTKSVEDISVKHLITAGLLTSGAELHPMQNVEDSTPATLLPDGRIEYKGARYGSLSAAGKVARGRAVNGWWFWHLSDGRRLMNVRSEFLKQPQ